MATNIKYEIILYWSKDDQAFIAEVPELPGCAADGATYQEALANAEIIVQEWIENRSRIRSGHSRATRPTALCITGPHVTDWRQKRTNQHPVTSRSHNRSRRTHHSMVHSTSALAQESFCSPCGTRTRPLAFAQCAKRTHRRSLSAAPAHCGKQ